MKNVGNYPSFALTAYNLILDSHSKEADSISTISINQVLQSYILTTDNWHKYNTLCGDVEMGGERGDVRRCKCWAQLIVFIFLEIWFVPRAAHITVLSPHVWGDVYDVLSLARRSHQFLINGLWGTICQQATRLSLSPHSLSCHQHSLCFSCSMVCNSFLFKSQADVCTFSSDPNAPTEEQGPLLLIWRGLVGGWWLDGCWWWLCLPEWGG